MSDFTFDHIAVIDWSAANKPTTGKDSIWIAWLGPTVCRLENPATRHQAMGLLKQWSLEALKAGETALLGFDFSFAYPVGTAAALGVEGWDGIWRLLAEKVKDAPDNSNNRFDLASGLNKRMGLVAGPFWAHPPGRSYTHLWPKRPGYTRLAERRYIEQQPDLKAAQPGWKLAYPGSVGSQTLMGIARLEAFRHDPDFHNQVSVWPFQPAKALVLAELYPSIFPLQTWGPHRPKDAHQVISAARLLVERQAKQGLQDLWEAPDQQPNSIEGWTFGYPLR